MTIAPYVLIGGRSSRFGSEKATYVLDGQTLAERAASLCRRIFVGSEVSLVAAEPGQFPELEKYRAVTDNFPGRGAIGAIEGALSDAREDWAFVLACDLPLVSAEFIELLTGLVTEEFDAVVPVDPEGQWQPLCGFYRTATCLPIFTDAAAKNGRLPSLRQILCQLRTRTLEFREYSHLPGARRILKNVNTRDDLVGIE